MRTIASIAEEDPHEPVFAFRPASLVKATRYFLRGLNAKILYAVKTNPELHVLKMLYAEGVRSFDVASIYEIIAVMQCAPDAELYFMNPVKSSHAIHEAYFKYHVRHFAFDCLDEFEKILKATNNAKDLCLHLRLTIPNNFSELMLSEKFGAGLHEAPDILKAVRGKVAKLGVTFHVGSQCMHPDAYRIAMRMAAQVVKESRVTMEYFNVGGGFPSVYPGMMPPSLDNYFEAIHREFAEICKKHPGLILLAEPGRAIVAESSSVIVRVELRKGNKLYINDGTYGCLFDAGSPNFIFPVQLVGSHESNTNDLQPFRFYGPTCDSIDSMKGPFYLPHDIQQGDYIEIGQMGAYGRTLSTGFNGFQQRSGFVEVSDLPLMSMYQEESISSEPLEVIAA